MRPHPHIGLATPTYLFAGAMMHRDSTGAVQRIEPGALNLMSAGRGVVHSERTPEVALYAPTTPFVLDGRSIGPRHLWWNFVSGETERIPAPPWRPAAGS